MQAYLLRVNAKPGDKIAFDGVNPVGYFQDFGITVEDDSSLRRHVEEYVLMDTGGTVLEIDDIVVADLEGKHRAIRDVCQDPSKPGIWYVGGCAFYDDDEEEG